MLDINSFSNAVALIYDAAMDVERWDNTLAFIGGLFAGDKAQISFATSIVDLSFVRVWGVAPEQLAQAMPKYRELTKQDPRLSSIQFKAVHCRQVVSDEVLRSSEIYKQILAPSGIEYSMYFVIYLSQDAVCVLSVMRGPEDTPFTEQDCVDFSRLVPHVQRAITLHGTFHQAQQKADAARAIIDSMPLGMLVIDDDYVVLANRAARSLLDEGSSLKISNGRIWLTTPEANAKLEKAIREASIDIGGKPTGLILQAGPTDQIRVLVRSLRSPSSALLGVERNAVAIYLSDSRASIETPEEILQQLFGLTPREAAVLRALLQGDDAQRIAKRLGIGIQTVRTHIQRIMRAAGANRQAELVTLVLSSPAWIAQQSK